jgi:hypothetical protein
MRGKVSEESRAVVVLKRGQDNLGNLDTRNIFQLEIEQLAFNGIRNGIGCFGRSCMPAQGCVNACI